MKQLTPEQLEDCSRAPQWLNVTPAQLFGPQSDYALSRRVCASNLQRYRELKLEYEYLSGQRARPDEFYQS
jgi:hypothetical protein